MQQKNYTICPSGILVSERNWQNQVVKILDEDLAHGDDKEDQDHAQGATVDENRVVDLVAEAVVAVRSVDLVTAAGHPPMIEGADRLASRAASHGAGADHDHRADFGVIIDNSIKINCLKTRHFSS